MGQTYNELIRTVTEDYLGGIDMDSIPSPETIENELLQATNNAIERYNLGPRDENAPIGAKLKDAYPDQKPPGERLKKLRELLPLQIALAIKWLHHAKLICWAADEGDGNYDVGVYQSEGDAKGVYDTRSDNLTRLIRRYDATISKRNVDEVVAILRAVCEVVSPCTKPDLVAVNNGLYDYGNKILMDFDPELVFTSKIGTDFVEDAPNPVIRNNEDGTDWDVVTWMDELSDDPKVVELLWQVLGAVVRPNVDWNKSAWLYSTLGNNGKGTFCTLARNLCGKGAWASIPIKAFGDDFKLESLTRVSAIITDENDTGTYLDDAAALKSIITGDPFLMNRKFKDPRSVKFRGFMIQCINSLPKLRDKSESLYRRLLVIPFEKRFEGCERKYIKGDYLNRPEVLEYVLHRILAKTDYYELDAPRGDVQAPCRVSRGERPRAPVPRRHPAASHLGFAPLAVPPRPVPSLVAAQQPLGKGSVQAGLRQGGQGAPAPARHRMELHPKPRPRPLKDGLARTAHLGVRSDRVDEQSLLRVRHRPPVHARQHQGAIRGAGARRPARRAVSQPAAR